MRVRALQRVTYAGRDYTAGDEFDTENDIHGKLLIQGKTVEEAVKEEIGKRRGNYRRRDMRADE